MDYVLKAAALSKRYKDFKALNGLSMNIPKGAIYGLVGKNCAGKTTLIRQKKHRKGSGKIPPENGGCHRNPRRLSGHDGCG